MLISNKNKFIFVHIYKVAGTSIDEALKEFGFNPNRTLIDKILRKTGLNTLPFYRYRNFHRHMPAMEIRQILPDSIYNNYFKFTFVRNPWDWQVSLFHWTLETPEHFQHNLFHSMSGFDEYIRWRVSPENIRLQKSFVTDQYGELIVDFIGKYEQLDRDFQQVCEVLKISTQLPHLNKSTHQQYQNYYDKTTKNLVELYFAEDIEFFGYQFDG